MSMNIEGVRAFYMTVIQGRTLESTRLDSPNLKEFLDVLTQEIADAPAGSMASPVNEWVGSGGEFVDKNLKRMIEFGLLENSSAGNAVGKYEINGDELTIRANY